MTIRSKNSLKYIILYMILIITTITIIIKKNYKCRIWPKKKLKKESLNKNKNIQKNFKTFKTKFKNFIVNVPF
jgi:hypothetical protein